MARPKTKEELQFLSQSNYLKLKDLIVSYSLSEQNIDFPIGTMNRNIRDILTHLHHWHLMMLKWHETGMKELKPTMPAEGYTWKTLPDLNQKIWKDYQSINLEKAKEILENSYQEIQKIIESHSNEELFTKKKYKWTGSTSLGAYLVSSSSSHYDWAFKLIKKQKKAQ